MYKTILENISGVEIWPVIALIIFMTVFVGITIWALRMKKSEVDRMAHIPLEEDNLQKEGDMSHG